MKRSTKFMTFVLLISTLTFVACNDTDDGKYVEPISLYEKITGTWVLKDISQIDETALTSGITPNEINLFGEFNFLTFTLTLHADNNHQPTTYEVGGSAPELFPGTGYWDLDTAFPYANGTAPVLNLYSDASKSNLTGRINIVSIPGSSPDMELKLTRKSGGVAFVSYHYKLSNLNQ